MKEKDFQTQGTETGKTEAQLLTQLIQELLPNEIGDKSHDRLLGPLAQFYSGSRQLSWIFGVLQNELVIDRGFEPTSLILAEKEIAKCISECLSDLPEQRRNISDVQDLLRSYGVVRPLRTGKQSVSLHKVHVILQDNYADSCLCKLMNIMLCGFMNSETKVITF